MSVEIDTASSLVRKGQEEGSSGCGGGGGGMGDGGALGAGGAAVGSAVLVVAVSAVLSSMHFFEMKEVMSGTGAVTLVYVFDGGGSGCSGLSGVGSSKVQLQLSRRASIDEHLDILFILSGPVE